MALFSRKKKESANKTSKVSASAAKSADTTDSVDVTAQLGSTRSVLQGPRITEKSVLLNETGVYVFNVDVRATKPEIRQAIKRVYGVDPVDIRVVNHPGKVKRRGQKLGRTAKSRKAYVKLPAGQTIELV